MRQPDELVIRTPNPACPCCQAQILHTELYWKLFHPLAGTGTNKN